MGMPRSLSSCCERRSFVASIPASAAQSSSIGTILLKRHRKEQINLEGTSPSTELLDELGADLEVLVARRQICSEEAV